MSYTWVDGEVITAEKLNETQKPTIVNFDDCINDSIVFIVNETQDAIVHYVIVDDLNTYLNSYNFYIKDIDDNVDRLIPAAYSKINISSIDPSQVTSDSKCIIKNINGVILINTLTNSRILIIDDQTAIVNGTGSSGR